MAKIKMEYLRCWCTAYETGSRDTGTTNGEITAHLAAGFGECDYCEEYERISPKNNDCRHYESETVYEERTMSKFSAREGRFYGGEAWNGWILETSKREYSCNYLEIDGYVYCDNRKKGGE